MKTTVDAVWNGEIVKIQGRKATGKTAWELGLIVEGQAKLLCPIDMGYLAASITVASISQSTEISTVKPNPGKIIKGNAQSAFYNSMPDNFKKIDGPNDPNEVLIGSAVDYAAYVEFGTFRNDAQPFLRPALDMAKGKILTILEKNSKFYFGDYLNPKGKMTHAEAREASK